MRAHAHRPRSALFSMVSGVRRIGLAVLVAAGASAAGAGAALAGDCSPYQSPNLTEKYSGGEWVEKVLLFSTASDVMERKRFYVPKSWEVGCKFATSSRVVRGNVIYGGVKAFLGPQPASKAEPAFDWSSMPAGKIPLCAPQTNGLWGDSGEKGIWVDGPGDIPGKWTKAWMSYNQGFLDGNFRQPKNINTYVPNGWTGACKFTAMIALRGGARSYGYFFGKTGDVEPPVTEVTPKNTGTDYTMEIVPPESGSYSREGGKLSSDLSEDFATGR